MHMGKEGAGMILFLPACLPQLALAPDTHCGFIPLKMEF